MAVALVALTLVGPLPSARAFVEDPIPGYTGGFGEPSCHACHFDLPLDDSEGELRLKGVPERFTPGSSYRLTVVLERPGVVRGGFQLAARFAEGELEGASAGTLVPVDERVRTSRDDGTGVTYAHHSPEGTLAKRPGNLFWELEWLAPGEPVAPVLFHAAANASNDDDSELGDSIYTVEARSRSSQDAAGAESLVTLNRAPLRHLAPQGLEAAAPPP